MNKTGQIDAIHLSTGQWIIAKIIRDNGLRLTISTPAVPVMDQEGKKLQFMPWAPLIENQKEIEISYANIVTHHEAETDLASFYRQATGDLVVPKQALIVPGK